MSDSFTIEMHRYILNDSLDNSSVREAEQPSRWSRCWSDPTENLTAVYEHALETAQEWQARQKHYGSRVELIAENERFFLIEFPPDLSPALRTFVEDN